MEKSIKIKIAPGVKEIQFPWCEGCRFAKEQMVLFPSTNSHEQMTCCSKNEMLSQNVPLPDCQKVIGPEKAWKM